jgi:hypothetical protein
MSVTGDNDGGLMDELATHQLEIELARRFPFQVLITAPPERALAIASAIAERRTTSEPRLTTFDGAAILDPANWSRRQAEHDINENVIVRAVDAFSYAEQAALMRLVEIAISEGRRRVIATSSTCLLDRVQNGTFPSELYYRLNIIHILSGSCTTGCGTPSRPIIAA